MDDGDEMIQIPIPVFCGPIIRREMSRPSSVYFDLTILPDNDADSDIFLESVTFDNYFTYSITVTQPMAGTDDYCSILADRRLMHQPGAETDAQLSHTIYVSEFNEHYTPGRVLRFMLHQPSSAWNSFEVRNVKAFAKSLPAGPKPGRNIAGQNHATHVQDGASSPSDKNAGIERLTQELDIEEQLILDFRGILARCNKVTHSKLALGSQLEVEIVTKKSKKKKGRSS